MLNRKYNRIFILLNGKNEGAGINLNGSCDIEIINGGVKLYSYIGGIGRLREKERSLYLISSKGVEPLAVSVGSFEMKGSNAVLERNIDPDDVFGSGMAVEDITAAAVWSAADGPYRAVLEGFVSQKYNWQKNLRVFGREEKLEENKRADNEADDIKAENDTVNDISENKTDEANRVNEEAIQAAEACAEYYSPHDTFREIAEKFRRELDMLDEMGIVDKSFILGDKEDKKEEPKKEKSKKESALKNDNAKPIPGEKAKGCDDITDADRLFENNARLAAEGGTEWIRADYREMYFIPGAIKSLRQLFVRNSARKGRHMIAGRDGKKYYIGVPGSEEQREKAYAAGFYDFLTIGEMNGAGYWIKEL